MNGILSGLRETIFTVLELFSFLWRAKIWWLAPIVVVLLLAGVIVLFAETSAVAPFIYSLF